MSKVSRAVYQKVCEDNKKLIKDIRILVRDGYLPDPIKILCVVKWRKQFAGEKALNDLLMGHAKKYIKEHADELPSFLTYKYENKS